MNDLYGELFSILDCAQSVIPQINFFDVKVAIYFDLQCAQCKSIYILSSLGDSLEF